MAWRAAKSLLIFHAQCKPLAPHADPRSWGLKGDEHHDSTSDHAPHNFPGWGKQIVTAGDIPEAENLVPWKVLDSIRRSRDKRVKYAISEGQMFSSYPTSKYPAWTWRPGKGHHTHGHLSVVGDARADDTTPWNIGFEVVEDMTPDERRMLLNIAEWVGAQLLDKPNVTGIADAPGTPHNKSYPNHLLVAAKSKTNVPLVVNAEEVADKLSTNKTFIGNLAVAIVDEQHRRLEK